jgi:hypothetical protein
VEWISAQIAEKADEAKYKSVMVHPGSTASPMVKADSGKIEIVCLI